MRTARITLLIAAILAVPYLAVGLLSDGAYASRLLGGGVVLLLVGSAVAARMARQGKELDESQDERQACIVGGAMRFSFMVMAVAVQAYWAWQFAAVGNAGDTAFWLLVALWGSFAAGYAYQVVRH